MLNEMGKLNLHSLVLQHLQPDELEVKVVIGKRLIGDGVEIGEAVHEFLPLIRRSQCSSDVLA
jgi:hypothetical protein